MRLGLPARLDPVRAILTRARRQTDIRSIGSGNIGATNVLRTAAGARRGHPALRCAQGHGRGADRAAAAGAEPKAALVAALGAFVGHLFPVWLKFRGGKGVATFFGMLLVIAWPLALISWSFGSRSPTSSVIPRSSALIAVASHAGRALSLWQIRTCGAVDGAYHCLVCIAPTSRAFSPGTEGEIGKRPAANETVG